MTRHKERSVRGAMKSKVMDVSGFKLEPFNTRIEKGDHWLEVHTREGKRLGDEWIEMMGGIIGEDGKHFHQGINKDATNRFDRRRGVLKSSMFIATNALTGNLLDKDEIKGPVGEYTVLFKLDSDKRTKTVRVVQADLVLTSRVHDTTEGRSI